MDRKSEQWYTGKVGHGYQNGRTFGYPTANIVEVRPALALANGVYAARLLVDGREWHGMLYAGTRPTLSLTGHTIEIHIFDFCADIYDKEVRFAVVGKVRDEMRFATTDALIAQLRADEAKIRRMAGE